MKRFMFGLVVVAMAFATTTCAPAPPAPPPVEPDWTVEVTAVPASDQTAGVGAYSSAGSNCLWVQTRYRNPLGQLMLTFEMTQCWSWAGGRVTSAPPATVKGSVSDLARYYGWYYKGVIDGNDYFYDSPAVAGTNDHSGHASWRKGWFNKFAGAAPDARYPTIGIRVNAHGGWNYTVNR